MRKMIFLCIGFVTQFAFAGPWDQLSKDQKALYMKATRAQSESDARKMMEEDLAKMNSDPEHRCEVPCRYTILRGAGLIQGQTQDCSDYKRLLPVESTDASAIGRPFFFTELTPERIKGVRIGQLKTGSIGFGHSFAVLEICPPAQPNCDRPLEVAVHPGKDPDGKLIMGPRSYNDMLAAQESKDLTIREVSLNLSPQERKNFVDGLYEQMNQEKSKYNIFTNNCATSASDLVQLATGKPVKGIFTPDQALKYAAKQSGNPIQEVLSPTNLGELALKELGIKGTLADYAKLEPSQRYCSSENKNGILKKMAEVSGKGSEEDELKAAVQLVSSGGNSEKLGDECKKKGEKAAEVLNEVQKCEALESAVLFGQRMEVNKRLRKEENPAGLEDLKKNRDALAEKRKEFVQKLQEVDEYLGTFAKQAKKAMKREVIIRVLVGMKGKSIKARELAAQLDDLVSEMEDLDKKTNEGYAKAVGKAGVANPGSLTRQFIGMLHEGFIPHCGSTSCPRLGPC